MEVQKKSSAGQALGIAGLVLGILALIISFIPCLGMYALFPGVIAIILSAIAYSQVSKSDSSKGLITAALIISILGTVIAGWQMYVLRHAVDNIEQFGNEFKDALEEELGTNLEDAIEGAIEDLEKVAEELEDEFDEATENEDDIEELEGNVDEANKELEEALEELEDDTPN